ncbi:MAG: molybdenum cofactor biosynthesis protein MoaE [Deferribacterales bacterium]
MFADKVICKLVDGVIDIKEIYQKFYLELDDSTGTILIHHGKAKFPGKYIKDYSKIELYLKVENAEEIIIAKAIEIYDQYRLNKMFVYHSLGTIYKNDPILFIAVEGKDRETAFIGVREMLEFIKAEELVGLKECL